MAKLPSRDSLGGMPSARSGRAIATIDGTAPAHAMQRFGRTISGAGQEIGDAILKFAEDPAAEYETERRFQEFKFQEQQGLEERMRSVEPGQAHGFADTWADEYTERAREFFGTVPDHLKPKYDNKLFGVERDFYRSAATFSRNEQKRFALNSIEDDVKRLSLSPDLDSARSDLDSLLQLNPYLTPIEKDEVRRKALDVLEEQNIEWRIRRGDDLDEIIRDLETGASAPGTALSAPTGESVAGLFQVQGLPIENGVDPQAPYMGRPRSEGDIRRIIVHGDVSEDAGALLEYGRRVDRKRGFDPNYHFYIARDGRVIQGVPLDRRANHTLGNNKDSIGIVIAGADAGRMPTPEQEAAAKRLISSLGKTYGIDPQNVMGHGELQPGRRNKLEGGNIAADIRAQGFVPDEDAPTQVAQAETGMMADGEGAKLPSLSKYPNLSPQRRSALLNKARVARSAITQQEVKDDIERIRRTGEPEVGPDGKTSLDRASRFLTKNQVDQLRIDWDEARMEYDAISPLRSLSELEDEDGMSDVDRHIAALSPDEKAPEESYASRARVLDKTLSAWKKIQEERRKDPAKAVNDQPEVRTAFEVIQSRVPEASIVQHEDGELEIEVAEGQPAVSALKAQEMVMEARLEAQARLGIPEVYRSPITRRQAERLLDMPDPSLLNEKEFYDKLRSAADKAEDTYGPRFGRQAFESAVRFKLREKEHKEIAAGVIAKMARGEPVTQRDINRINTLDEIATMDSVFSDQFAPAFAMQETERPFISPEFGRETMPAIQQYQAREVAKRPTPNQIDWVKQDPKTRAPIFDMEFGRGAWARYANEPADTSARPARQQTRSQSSPAQ